MFKELVYQTRESWSRARRVDIFLQAHQEASKEIISRVSSSRFRVLFPAKAAFPTKVVLTVESVPPEILGNLRARGDDFRTLVAPFNIEELQLLCFPSSHPKKE